MDSKLLFQFKKCAMEAVEGAFGAEMRLGLAAASLRLFALLTAVCLITRRRNAHD